jgi:hypothetical protein
MAGNGDAIIALEQKRMDATLKQDFVTLESIKADVGGPDQGTATKGLRDETGRSGPRSWSKAPNPLVGDPDLL